jgi:hypothetical protein
MSEQTFFEYGDVKVTNARFINGGQTYAMSNITSVKAFEQKPKRFWPAIFILIGLGILGNGSYSGLIIILAAAAFIFLQKTIYHVMLSTSAGETSALKTHQKEYLQKVVAAVNEAIVHRG